jgi:hypothetical protein
MTKRYYIDPVAGEFTFDPGKTYASHKNAQAAADKLRRKLLAAGMNARFMVVVEPQTMRFAPIFFNASTDALGVIAHQGFTVVN